MEEKLFFKNKEAELLFNQKNKRIELLGEAMQKLKERELTSDEEIELELIRKESFQLVMEVVELVLSSVLDHSVTVIIVPIEGDDYKKGVC